MYMNNYNGVPDTISMVEGGHLELEGESSLSPLLLRGGGGGRGADDPTPYTPETVVVRNPLPDGSIAVEASTTTPRSNGYRDVRVEHFVVPSSNAVASVGYFSPVPIPDYLTRVEYRVLSPDSVSEHVDCDDIDDDDVFSTGYFSQSSFDSADVTSILRGHVDFEDDAFSSSCSRTRQRRRRRRIFIGAVLFFLVVIIGAAFTRSSRRHNNNRNSQEDEYAKADDKISNATSSDASMPPNRTNVTDNRSDVPLLSMHM
ncbi:hypothetical protein ACHAW5_009535 [Stephanodiscus triporus]|uniref:Uncharacterized protein n=1 Tax=Stephanodiscus triporus TaxID=2934178 RepID=A0ABD3NAK6_9STRA